MFAARASGEEVAGEGDGHVRVVRLFDPDAFGAAAGADEQVGLVVERQLRAADRRYGRDEVGAVARDAGHVVLRRVRVEVAFGLDRRVGAEDDRVVVVVGRRVYRDGHALDVSGQILREAERQPVAVAAVRAERLRSPLDDLAAFGVHAREAPGERLGPLGQGEVPLAVGREAEGVAGDLLWRVGRVADGGQRVEVAAEVRGDAFVEGDLDDGVLQFALHLGRRHAARGDREAVFTLVEAFGVRGGDLFAGLDRHAVFAGEQFELGGQVFARGVFAQQGPVGVVEPDGEPLQRIVVVGRIGARCGDVHPQQSRLASLRRRFGVVLRAAGQHGEQCACV